MRTWKATVDIKGILRVMDDVEFPTPEQVEKVGKDIALLIKANIRKMPFRFREDWEKVADDLEEAAETQDDEELNYMLSQVYDLGDASNVFLGA